jgi:hypothetical protein
MKSTEHYLKLLVEESKKEKEKHAHEQEHEHEQEHAQELEEKHSKCQQFIEELDIE